MNDIRGIHRSRRRYRIYRNAESGSTTARTIDLTRGYQRREGDSARFAIGNWRMVFAIGLQFLQRRSRVSLNIAFSLFPNLLHPHGV